jgi:Xaa-Pro aminopeptidase
VAESPTVAGQPVPEAPDLARMHRERVAKLRAEMAATGLDAVLLLGTSPVSYATGALAPGTDSSRALISRPVALLTADGLDLFTPYPDGVPAEFPPGQIHEAVFPEFDEGAARLVSELADRVPAGARLGCDELTHSLRRHLAEWELASASTVLGPAKMAKTADELACIRRAQSINEQAMVDVIPLVRPGVRQSDLSARFLRRIHELGATSNGIDPIWQPMPTTRSAGPWTTHGDVAFPTASSDRFLREGDVVWVDTGIGWQGYASDFGRTWIVSDDPRPTARQQTQFERWAEVVEAVLERVKPGATGLELVRAAVDANGGTRPWIEHFYLAHGVGTDSAEMPLIGTDLGDGFDEQLVLAPGMVLVLEPVIWDDGAAGYRSEDIYAVTDDGWTALSDFAFDPYGHPAGLLR